tara:strand:- start:257 stop:583 length:327 start_codon:yes stop_codon:yes gene_type:complete
VDGRDVPVIGCEGDVEIGVVPQQSRFGLLLVTCFPPGEDEITDCRCRTPGGFVDAAIDHDRTGGAHDSVLGQVGNLFDGADHGGRHQQGCRDQGCQTGSHVTAPSLAV